MAANHDLLRKPSAMQQGRQIDEEGFGAADLRPRHDLQDAHRLAPLGRFRQNVGHAAVARDSEDVARVPQGVEDEAP